MIGGTVKEARAASLRLIGIILLIFALACDRPSEDAAVSGSRGRDAAGSGADSQPSDFAGNREAGTTVTVLANDHPWVYLIKEKVHEFEELTGIEVDIDLYPEEQFRAKREVEMRSGTSDIDVYMIMPGNSLSKYVANGWVAPLEELKAVESLRWPNHDFDDFYDVVIESGSRDGRQYTIPILLETSLLAYNRELLDRFDLSVPETMDELEEAARTIYEGTEGEIAGITLRGRGAAATSQWADFLYSFGGTWFDESGDAAIHSERAIEALEFYGRLLREYGPRGASGNRWYESVSHFVSGRAAMIYDANVFRPNYEDPENSRIAGNVGYTQIPEGPAGRIPHISHWGLGIYSGSQSKEAAWLFLQWATARKISKAAHERGIPAARESVWKTYDSTSEWTRASTRNYEIADRQWNPPVLDIDAAREAVGEAIVAAILGHDIESAARRASRRLDRIVSREAED